MTHDDLSVPSQPAPASTVTILVGLLATSWFAAGTSASTLASEYAIGVGLSLAVATAIDFRGNIRNLIRTDVMALAALYFLSLAEFLFPQPAFDDMLDLREVEPALIACLLGFGGIALGRHFSPDPGPSVTKLIHFAPPGQLLVTLFLLSFVGGYLHMLMAVNFDFQRWIDAMMAPRFSQPWGRGRFGDWRALLYELNMVIYLVPPLAGVILAQRKDFHPFQLVIVAAGLVFTLFYGFSSGTRNIFATFLATFLVAYAFTAGPQRSKETLVLSALAAVGMFLATTVMLNFRQIGLTSYLEGYEVPNADPTQENFFVDYNLYVIAQLVQVFPNHHDFLGFEIPYLALIRPIPRAIWSGKPEGMSISIEDALGVEGLTLASTFIGEAYVSGGLFGVAATALVFGMMMSWWNKLGRGDNSPFGHLLFASGFFAAVISMRSMLVFTTAILPPIAAIVFGHWAISRGMDMRRRRLRETHDDA